MNNTKRRSPWKVLLYFALALIFALLAMLASRLPVLQYVPSGVTFALEPNLQWIFWLLITLSLFSLVPLFDAILFRLHLRKLLPRILDGLYAEDASQSTGAASGRLRAGVKSLGGRLILSGLAVFATVFLLSHMPAVRDKELDSVLYENISRMFGKYTPASSESIAVSLVLETHTTDFPQYLHDCLTIVQDLKSAGAKAVLVDASSWELPYGKISQWLKKIENTGIAVIGLPEGKNFRFTDSVGEVRYSRASSTLRPYELREDPFLFRIKPEGLQRQIEKQPLDITLELLRKFHNYHQDLEPKREGDRVVFGDYRIPVTSDGWMFARQSGVAWVGPLTHVGYGFRNDSLRYRGLTGSVVWSSSAFSDLTWQDLRRRFEGKIVFLGQPDYAGPILSFVWTNSYISALQAISQHSVISTSQTLHVWVTVVCILLAGLVAFKLQPLPSLLVIFVLGCVTLLACWLLYDRFDILVDAFYPLLAVGMSMFVFPAITVVEKMGEVEEAS